MPAELVARNPLLLLLVAWLLGPPLYDVDSTGSGQLAQLLLLHGQLLQSQHLPCGTVWSTCMTSDTVLLVALTAQAAETSTIQCILTDFLLALSNVGFLPPFWPRLYRIHMTSRSRALVKAAMWFPEQNILLCSCQDHRSVCSWRCIDILAL